MCSKIHTRICAFAYPGLYAGAATVIAGIVGTVLGAKTTAYLEPMIKNVYFFVPALYSIPAVVLLILTLNLELTGYSCFLFALASMIFIWTHLSPMSAVSINVIPTRFNSSFHMYLCIFVFIYFCISVLLRLFRTAADRVT